MTSDSAAADVRAAEAHLQSAADALEGNEEAEAALTEIATIQTNLGSLLEILPAVVEGS